MLGIVSLELERVCGVAPAAAGRTGTGAPGPGSALFSFFFFSFNDTEIFPLVFCFVRSFSNIQASFLYVRVRLRGHRCVYLPLSVCASVCVC